MDLMLCKIDYHYFKTAVFHQIRALSVVLRRPLEVIQADGPSIVVGDDQQGEPLILS